MEKDGAIDLGIGEYAVVNGRLLACRGLGSCVAVILYRKDRPLGGMAHAMLPKSVDKVIGVLPQPKDDAKYVDRAVDLLVSKLGRDCEAKLVGGASLFNSDDIGKRNVEAARAKLAENGVRIVSEDVGGSRARTCLFYVNEKRVVVRTSMRVGFNVTFVEKEI